MHLQWLLRSSLWLLSLLYRVAAYDPAPRWGQAAVLVNDTLYIHGGKVDQSNQFSYTSAPNTNQVLLLSLSSQFTAQSPPWTLVNSSSTNASTTLAWHSLSAFNTTHALVFGGQPDPNSQIVLVDLPDSAAIFDVSTRTSPVWIPEPSAWKGEPVRRLRHSSSSSPAGQVFIIGGEKADGSQLGFSDHSYFTGSTMSFNSLPTSNAPPDLYGHASVILSDGRILVFGGYSPSQSTLIPFSTIWILDSSTMLWSLATVNPSSLPSPRVAFAAVFIGSGKVIIQGGCDSAFQTNFADGWVLDTTTNPWAWSTIGALSQIGARRDHFAVSYGGQVLFGFGYLDNGPAPSTLEVYDTSSGTCVSTYTPPPAGSTTQTLPPLTSQSNIPSPGGPSGSNSNPTPPANAANSGNGNPTAVALGSVFGILGFIVVGLGTAYYVRRRRQLEGEREFMALSEDDGDIIGETHQLARSIPVVKMHNAPAQHGILGSLGVALKMKNARSMVPRRDMLADEDARSFGEWYNRRSVTGSTWSLKSILGGGMKTRSRQASSASSPLGEKDPFADQETVVRDERTGLISLTARVPSRRSRQETSYQSWRTGSTYRDPFSDPLYDDAGDFDSAELYSDSGAETTESPERHILRARPPLLHLHSVLPVSQGGHPLSPLSEHTSQTTLPSQKISSNSSQGHDIPLNLVDSPLSSPSVPSKTTSIINTSNSSLFGGGSQPIRRSDSWWSRFARANLLDRRSSGNSRKATYEIRDPNPPPKLGAIEEGTSPRGSALAATDKEKPPQLLPTLVPAAYPPRHRTHGRGQSSDTGPLSANLTRIYGADRHGKSLSSLRTADSEAIERMAGTMDVVHYNKSRSQSRNRYSTSGLSIETSSSASVSERENKNTNFLRSEGPDDDNLILFASPLDADPPSPMFRHPLAADQGDDPTLPRATDAATESRNSKTPTPPLGNIVADKVRGYERRMSMEASVSPITTPNTKYREERTKKRVEVKYGLAPKPSLFVANPDKSHSASTDS